MTDAIEVLAFKLAKTIKSWDPSINTETDRIRYYLALKINYFGSLFVVLILGVMSGHFLNSVVAFTSFVILRRLTGGFHLSLTPCMILSVFLISLSSMINVSAGYIRMLSVASIVLILIFSNHGTNEFDRERNKSLAIVILCMNFQLLSPVVASAFLAQSITLIKLRR